MSLKKDLAPVLNCKKFFANLFQNMHNSTSRLIRFLRKYLFCCCCPAQLDRSSHQPTTTANIFVQETGLHTDMGTKISKKPSSRENLSTNLSKGEIDLLKSSTNMTEQEIIEFHDNFLKECRSGFLTKKEFITMFKLLHPIDTKKQKVEKFCEYVFK